jgi:hypothetical protein
MQYQQKHLHDCLKNARESEDEQWEKEILAIIQCEKNWSFWRWINYVMGRAHGGSVHCVLVENVDQEGTLTKNITQKLVQGTIFINTHHNQFFLVEAAPICTGGFRGCFGYNAVTRTAKAILDGSYAFSPGFDQATTKICKKCAQIWKMGPMDSFDNLTTKEEWRRRWMGHRELALSLESGLHFGHYIADTCSNHISYFHALKATLIIR